MTLLHVSLPAAAPASTAQLLAQIMGGEAMPFPPCNGAWIAFSAQDDGTAIEVYPLTARITPGPETISFAHGPEVTAPLAAHAAIGSPLGTDDILALGKKAGWAPRICNRGPFQCVELWIDGRLLVEVLDPDMQSEYCSNMSVRKWRAMFGFPSEEQS